MPRWGYGEMKKCNSCGTTKTSLWYKSGVQCRTCYTREFRAKQTGICETCDSIKSFRWRKKGTQCETCYRKELRVGQTGFCKTCGTTEARIWFRNNTLCVSCYNYSYQRRTLEGAHPYDGKMIPEKCQNCNEMFRHPAHDGLLCWICLTKLRQMAKSEPCHICSRVYRCVLTKDNKVRCLGCCQRLNTYDLTLNELIGMPDACEICGSTKLLHIDHCHETGLVRGMLCQGCNHGLGNLGDNVAGLERALEYLNDAAGDPKILTCRV